MKKELSSPTLQVYLIRAKQLRNSKYPEIAPVFKMALPQKAEISLNPMLKLDTIDYDGCRRSYQQSPILKGGKPEFMDLLSMSKKLDSSARIGK